MLNLVLLKEDYEPWEPNVPAWELPKAREGERVEITIPDNPAALLTLQSRRLLLERNNHKVTGYRLLGGDFFSRENDRLEAYYGKRKIYRTIPTKAS